jgi:ADP-ribosyl-[dinitrogen reductase] hydrolase
MTLEDRFSGTLLGLACGDAVGATSEFRDRGSFEPVVDMVGGGVHALAPGEWTDDTSMAMCLAESLVACAEFDAVDQMQRYLRWYRNGYWSVRPRCFDIGITTERALRKFEKTGKPFCGPAGADTAGNGSIMRLAPVVLRYFPSQAEVLHHCAESSRTTHGAQLAIDGCRLLGFALLRLLGGCARDRCLEGAAAHVQEAAIVRIAGADFRAKPRSRIQSSGFVVHTLEAALWCLFRTESFEAAVLLAANLGDDADKVAAVTGQLAGAHYGASGIPDGWLGKLYRRQDIEALAVALDRRDRPTPE